MGGKGGGNTTSTVTQQNIPEEFYPYFERMLIRGEEASLQPYMPYEGQRMSGQTGDTLASQQMVRDIASGGQPGLDLATGLTAQGALASQSMLGQPGYEFSPYAGFQAGQVSPYAGFEAAQFNEFGFDPATQFTGDAVQQYMNPYMQNVVDIQKQRAATDYQIAQQQRNAAALGSGAFGGSRQAVAEAMAERDLLSRTNEIQASGLSNAYTDAQRMFEADRGANFAVQQARAAEAARVQGAGASELARVQSGQAGELGRTQGINISELGRTQAGQAGELGRVQGAQATENLARDQFGLSALAQSGQMAAQLAALSEQARAGDIQAAQLLEIMGRSNEARSQAELDIAFEDFMRQQNYPMEQLQQFSAMINGLPVANAGTTVQQTPYNPAQQALGMGISALGLYKGLTG
jgi:hypothetical protein